MTKPLVTVAVTTYNSAKYVVETLESINTQVYSNLELLVSDDYSTDNTVAICQKWIDENKARFRNARIVTVSRNTGVSANCNRCIAAAGAEWVKFIAGDDILLPNCISDNMDFAMNNPEAKIIFSHVSVFRNNFASENFIRTIPGTFPQNLMKKEFSARDQFERLLLSDRIPYTPSYFFKKEALISVGCYDEKWKIAEDYPMWLKLTGAGIKLFFFDKITVGYRQHEAALNNIAAQKIVKPLQLKTFAFRTEYVHKFLPWDIVMSERFSHSIAVSFEKLKLNNTQKTNLLLFRLLTVYANPFTYLISIKKHLIYRKRKNVFYSN